MHFTCPEHWLNLGNFRVDNDQMHWYLTSQTFTRWHLSCNITKPTKWVCAQRRHRPAWASAQSDQDLCCPHEETLGPELPTECTAKTLIRLGGCPGWSESSLGAHSFCWFCHVVAHLKLEKIRFLNSQVLSKHLPSRRPTWQLSLIVRKPVFRVYDQGRLRLACSVTEAR